MTPFLDRLMKLRATFDLYPWSEVIPGSLPANAQAGSQAPFGVQQTYGQVFERMPFLGWGVQAPAGGNPEWAFASLNSQAGTYLWSLGAGGAANKVNQALNPGLTNMVMGSYFDEWIPLGSGVELPALEKFTGQFSPLLDMTTSDGAALWTVLRGYRYFAKGSIDPPQRTRAEWAKMGATFAPFRYTATLPVDMTNANTQQSTDITFDSLFLCHSIRVRPQTDVSGATIATVPLIQIQISPTTRQPLFSKLCPWEGVIGPFKLRTQWSLPIPMSINPSEIWTLSALNFKPLVVATGVINMEYTFDGEKILLPKGPIRQPAPQARR